jgi:hypothetical protein
MVGSLLVDMFAAAREATKRQCGVVVGQDGEFDMIAWPNGRFTIVVPYKTFVFVDEEGVPVDPAHPRLVPATDPPQVV